MAEKSTALERMRKKVLESARSDSQEAVSTEAPRLKAALPVHETETVANEPVEQRVEAAPNRKLSTLGRMGKTAFGLISSRRENALPATVDSGTAADLQYEATQPMAEVDTCCGNLAVQAPEPVVSPDEVIDTAGVSCPEEPCIDHSDDNRQPSVVNREKIGWVSPAYTVSRSVHLDPQLVARNKCVAFLSDADEVESYRVLRTQILQRSRERGGNTIMITSALPGEGKTLTAVNLALTFAKEFRQTALLVDCDLRRQRIHELLGIGGEKGLNEYLLDDCPISELMVWPGVEKLTLISGGRTITESSELLGSPRMKELVEDMKHRYPERYVIFDVPAVLSGADALAFAPLVDHIVVTVKAGETPMSEVTRAVRMLPREKVLGVVLNRRRRGDA